ncbi:response regulator [Mariniflexile soesokkakense]|uniref:Response regulator n=1 Tax=Mariniflexile soesokkakense TaxID=1343160 RepID=A0ABV0ACS7_9FLAO
MMSIKNVMLVDDNKIDLFVSQKVIERYDSNIRVVHFKNTLLALEYLKISLHKNNLNHFTRPNMLFLDINMSKCTGFEFLERLGRLDFLETNNLKIYILSSSGNLKDINKVNMHPLCSGYINKPLTMSKLQGVIDINVDCAIKPNVLNEGCNT